jgi:hypothetical protein
MADSGSATRRRDATRSTAGWRRRGLTRTPRRWRKATRPWHSAIVLSSCARPPTTTQPIRLHGPPPPTLTSLVIVHAWNPSCVLGASVRTWTHSSTEATEMVLDGLTAPAATRSPHHASFFQPSFWPATLFTSTSDPDPSPRACRLSQ